MADLAEAKKNALIKEKTKNVTKKSEALSKAPEQQKTNQTQENTTHLKIFNTILDKHNAAEKIEKEKKAQADAKAAEKAS